jgi:hypothetical protein
MKSGLIFEKTEETFLNGSYIASFLPLEVPEGTEAEKQPLEVQTLTIAVWLPLEFKIE